MRKRTHLLLRLAGWLVAIGGSVVTIFIFWIDHMNSRLWSAMALGVLVSIVVGGTIIWFARETV